ncbi:MAG: hypothetical protein DDT22_00857 [candidate division WS2 bacterium]|nr:hypothetical protein [Candidatus Lithacetigena glycinireducens]
MFRQFAGIIGSIFVLIAIVLILTRARETVAIINSIGSLSIQGIKTLQARA